MARAKQYADRVNVIKSIKIAVKWPFAPVVERNGGLSAIMSGSGVRTSTIPKAVTTSSEIGRAHV